MQKQLWKLFLNYHYAKLVDKVNYDSLMWLLRTRTGDVKVPELVHRMLTAGMPQGGLLSQRIKGTPQGVPLSPLLSKRMNWTKSWNAGAAAMFVSNEQPVVCGDGIPKPERL